MQTFVLAREKEAWLCATPYKASKHRDHVEEWRYDNVDDDDDEEKDNWRNASKGGLTHLWHIWRRCYGLSFIVEYSCVKCPCLVINVTRSADHCGVKL